MDEEYDYRKRADRAAFRDRYPIPFTGMIGNKRMYLALDVIEAYEKAMRAAYDMLTDGKNPDNGWAQGLAADVLEKALWPQDDVPVRRFRLDSMFLSVRADRCLREAGLEYVGQVMDMTDSELMKVRQFGRKSLTEVREAIRELNPDNPPQSPPKPKPKPVPSKERKARTERNKKWKALVDKQRRMKADLSKKEYHKFVGGVCECGTVFSVHRNGHGSCPLGAKHWKERHG